MGWVAQAEDRSIAPAMAPRCCSFRARGGKFRRSAIAANDRAAFGVRPLGRSYESPAPKVRSHTVNHGAAGYMGRT